MPYDIDGARKAGIPDSEIASTLAGIVGDRFDLNGARQANVSDQDIINTLISDPAVGGLHQAVPAAKAPAAEATETPDKPWLSRVAEAPQAFYEGLKHGVMEYGPAASQGARLSGSTLGLGTVPTPEETAQYFRSQKEFENLQTPQERKFAKKITDLSKDSSTKEKKAKIWEPPEAPVMDTGFGVPMSVMSPYEKQDYEERLAKYEAGIKDRLKELNLPDTPENRSKASREDASAARSANYASIKEMAAQVGTNPEGLARSIGNMLPVMGTSIGAGWLTGLFSKSPKFAASVMGLVMQPHEVQQRFMGEVSRQLAERNLEPTLENITELYNKNPKLIAEARNKAVAQGTTSAAVMSALPMKSAKIMQQAEQDVVQAGIEAANKAAAEKATARTASALGSSEAAEQFAREAAEAGATPTASRIEVARAIDAAREGRTFSEKALPTLKAAGINLSAPVAAAAAAKLVTGEDIDPKELAETAIAQAPFGLLEIPAFRRAFRQPVNELGQGPTEAAYVRDIADLWNKAEKETDLQKKERFIDLAVRFDRDRYHNTGERAADREDIRSGFNSNMEKAADYYRDALDAELSKPEDKQDPDRIKLLKSKLDLAHAEQVYTSPHETVPELTVEEFHEFQKRMVEANSIEDPTEADKVQQEVLADYQKLVGDRHAAQQNATPVAGSEVGESGNLFPGTAGRGAGERVQPGAPEEPRTEEAGAAGVGGVGGTAAGANAGEEAARRSLSEEDLPFRREGVPGAVDHEEAVKLANGYKDEWGVNIRAARNAEELRKLSGHDLPDDVRGFFDPATGDVWVNSGNHSSAADVKSTIFHETLGHYGLKSKFADSLDNLLLDIYKKNENVRREVAEWRKRKIGDTEETNRDTYSHLPEDKQVARAVEEILAERSEKGKINTAAHRQLIALVRKYIRMIPKIGDKMKFSDNDILHILRDAHEEVVSGRSSYQVGADGQLRYSFIGPQAKLSPIQQINLDKAVAAEKAGKDPEIIRFATGWIRNPADGGWRKEIPDLKARVEYDPDSIQEDHPILLKDLYSHPELYRRYPDIANIEVVRTDTGDSLGYQDPYNNIIGYSKDITSRAELKKVLVHETTHAIQEHEGFGKGGSPTSLGRILSPADRAIVGKDISDAISNIPIKQLDPLLANIVKDPNFYSDLEAGEQWPLLQLGDYYEKLPEAVRDVMHDAYENLLGEREAREAVRRMDMSEEAIKNRPSQMGQYKNAFVDQNTANNHPSLSVAQKISSAPVEPIPRNSGESIRYSRAKQSELRQAEQEMPKFDKNLWDKFRNKFSEVSGAAASNAIHILDTARVAEIYGHKLPGVREVHEITGKQAAADHLTILKLGNTANTWAATLQKLAKAKTGFSINEFNDIAHQTTINQIDPLDANTQQIAADVNNGRIIAPSLHEREVTNLMNRWDALPAEAKDVYKGLREYYDDVRNRYLNIVQKYAGKTAADRLRQMFQDTNLQVYLPLTRHGSHWVSLIDNTGEKIHTAFDSPSERNKFIAWANKTGNYTDITAYHREENMIDKAPPSALLSDVIEKMKANGAGQAMLEAVYETFLDYNSSGSLAQMFRKRKNTEGYNQSVLGSFGQVAPRLERQISRMEYSEQYKEAMERFHEQLQNQVLPAEFPNASQFTKGNLPLEYHNLQSYLNRHINTMLNPLHTTGTKIANALTTADYYMTIAGNASTGLVNTMSLPLVSMPLLEGEFGVGKTFSAYERAVNMIQKGGFDKAYHEFLPDWTFGVNATGEYKMLHDALMEKGVISRSLGTDLYSLRKVSIEDYSRAWEKTRRILGYVMQNTERFNREASSLAAYMLKRESGASIDDAISFAIEHTEYVHGPGSVESTAPIFKKPAGRVLYALRRFQATTIGQQMRLLWGATVGIPGKSRTLAAKQLAVMTAHAGLLVGAKGIPFMGGALLMASMAHSLGLVGDEDKPFVPDEKLRDWSGIFYGGVMDYLLGADMSSRASLTNLIWRDDPAELRRSGGWNYMLNQIGGVNASLLKGIYDAGNLIGEGEYERGFETVAPAAVRSLAAAARLAGEGAKTIGGGQMVTKSGQPIDVTIGTVLRRGLGFNDREIAEYQGRHRNLKEDAAQYNDAITATKRDYVKAVDKMINAKTPELRKEYQERAIKAAQQWVRVHAKNRVPFTFGEAKDFVNSYTAGKLAGMWDVDGVKGSLMREAFLREHHDANEWDNFWANPKKEGGED